MKSIIALIPARSGSKGVPNKNIRLLGGRPLIDWTIQACLRSVNIERVIVSTDSQSYADLAKKLGAEAPFLRPLEISSDRSTDYDFVIHALDWLKASNDEPNLIVHMRPTTPFRDPSVVDDAINSYLSSPHATCLRSVHEMSESAYKTFEIDELGYLKSLGAKNSEIDAANNARQIFASTYQANGYVDVLSVSYIRENKKLHGNRVIPFITHPIIELDTEDDFSNLEYQLSKNFLNFQRIFG